MNTAEVRRKIIEYVRRELVGPAPGFPAIQVNKEEILRSQDPPRLRYSTGILFPLRCEISDQTDIKEQEVQSAEAAPVDEVKEPAESAGASDLIDSANPTDQQPETDADLNLANQYLPSAMGLSALVELPERLTVRIEAAQYEKCVLPGFGKPRSRPGTQQTPWVWFRKPFSATVFFDRSELFGKRVVSIEKPVNTENGTRLAVHVVSRPREIDGIRLVTVTLLNRNQAPTASSDALCFFQCRFEVSDEAGSQCFLEYPDRKISEEAEERSLRFLYRKKKVFAVGHGCAADWQTEDAGRCERVWTESLPVYELRPITHVEIPGLDLSMRQLATEDAAIDLCEALAAAYERWIEDQKKRVADPNDIPASFIDVAMANVASCETCLLRMRRGIALLRRL